MVTSSHAWLSAAAGRSHAPLSVLSSAGEGQPAAPLRGHFSAEEVGQGEETGGICDCLLGDVPVVMK